MVLLFAAKEVTMVEGTSAVELSQVKASFVYALYDKGDAWSVISYRDEDTGRRFNACGHHLPRAKDTDFILFGSWQTTEKYGRQFNVEFSESVLPTSKKGFVSYMKAMKCGVGKIKATMIYNKFGEYVWQVIDQTPYKLMEVKGVSQRQVERIVRAMEETHLLREILKTFQGKFDISTQKARVILDAFGEQSLSVIRETPYRLCELRGFSFRMVDQMALSLGADPTATDRIFSAVPYVFDVFSASGDVCVKAEEYIDTMVKELNAPLNHPFVTEGMVKVVLRDMLVTKRIRSQGNLLYTNAKYQQEAGATEDISRLINGTLKVPTRLEMLEALTEIETKTGITYERLQREAIFTVFERPVSIITGGPGTGKTTIIKGILAMSNHLYGEYSNPVLMAPTGKATKRMRESTDYPAVTIHSAVGYMGEESVNAEALYGNLFIIDEASMVDMFILSALLAKIPAGSRVVFVGDPDQLPSVGAGEVLYQLIRSKTIPVTKLNVIYRQSSDNPIVENAEKINKGNVNLKFVPEMFYEVETKTEQETLDYAISTYMSYTEIYGKDNVIMLCPMRRTTEHNPTLSVEYLNRQLQEMVNPLKEGMPELKGEKYSFRIGDKVMQKKNERYAKNGDTGIISEIKDVSDEDDKSEVYRKAVVVFDGEEKPVEYDEEMLKNLDLAYVTTVHKSQGSEYENVIILCVSQHKHMLKRNLLYTAVTRAKKRVVLIGQMEAVQGAIRTADSHHRRTLLGDRLHSLLPEVKEY